MIIEMQLFCLAILCDTEVWNTYSYICYCLRVSEAELALAREDNGLLPSNFPPDKRARVLFTAAKVSWA